MTIEIKDYVLSPTEQAKERFDLSKKVMRTKQATQEQYEGSEDLGYGMEMKSCLELIIATELADKKLTLSLGEYIKEWKKERDVILSLTNQTTL